MADKKATPAMTLLKQFSRLYRENVGVEYVPSWGRDLKMFGDLLGTLPVEKLGELIDRYFATERKTYSIPYFKCDINNLMQANIAEAKQYNKPKMVNADSDRFF